MPDLSLWRRPALWREMQETSLREMRKAHAKGDTREAGLRKAEACTLNVCIADLDADLRALQGQIGEVVKYARHLDTCESLYEPFNGHVYACTCGLANTLAAWLPPQTTEG